MRGLLGDMAGMAMAGMAVVLCRSQMALSVSASSLAGLGGSVDLGDGLGQPMGGLLGDLAGVAMAGMEGMLGRPQMVLLVSPSTLAGLGGGVGLGDGLGQLALAGYCRLAWVG